MAISARFVGAQLCVIKQFKPVGGAKVFLDWGRRHMEALREKNLISLFYVP